MPLLFENVGATQPPCFVRKKECNKGSKLAVVFSPTSLKKKILQYLITSKIKSNR
jgi:hypothetical protein